jgi:hypothetical protein
MLSIWDFRRPSHIETRPAGEQQKQTIMQTHISSLFQGPNTSLRACSSSSSSRLRPSVQRACIVVRYKQESQLGAHWATFTLVPAYRMPWPRALAASGAATIIVSHQHSAAAAGARCSGAAAVWHTSVAAGTAAAFFHNVVCCILQGTAASIRCGAAGTTPTSAPTPSPSSDQGGKLTDNGRCVYPQH